EVIGASLVDDAFRDRGDETAGRGSGPWMRMECQRHRTSQSCGWVHSSDVTQRRFCEPSSGLDVAGQSMWRSVHHERARAGTASTTDPMSSHCALSLMAS